jgi:hypothetical protein
MVAEISEFEDTSCIPRKMFRSVGSLETRQGKTLNRFVLRCQHEHKAPVLLHGGSFAMSIVEKSKSNGGCQRTCEADRCDAGLREGYECRVNIINTIGFGIERPEEKETYGLEERMPVLGMCCGLGWKKEGQLLWNRVISIMKTKNKNKYKHTNEFDFSLADIDNAC